MKKLLLLLLIPFSVYAWEPTKPITVLAPSAPGAGGELSARAALGQLEKEGKAKFVFGNIPGADGNLMIKRLMESAPDGYTLGLPSCQSGFVFGGVLYPEVLPMSPFNLSLIAGIGKSPMAFIANAKSPVNSVPELINAVTKEKRDINFAVGGMAHQLTWEYFMDKVGGDKDRVRTVLYKGPMPAAIDTAGGITEFGIMPVAVARPLIDAGKVKLLGIASERHVKNVPKTVALMKDYAPGLNVYGCWTFALPPDTPADVVKWYVDNVIPTLKTQQFKEFADENDIFIDETTLSPTGVRKDLTALRKQWLPYVTKMPK
jgi:tripartite-type tricarboxylate transporter receptor subunit TctC